MVHVTGATVERMLLSAETPDFREPREPHPGDEVVVRLRVERPLEVRATLVLETGERHPMVPVHIEGPHAWHEARLVCPGQTVRYHIEAVCDEGLVVCQRYRTRRMAHACERDPRADFVLIPDAHVPDWSTGALQYQIFVDRFANGDEGNDVVCAEYAYEDAQVAGTLAWDAPLTCDDYRSFRGGDLKGVLSRLDYLQSLGVEAIYLNPIFTSPSSHKYDTQDYLSIDPHFGVIVEDGGPCLDAGDLDCVHATRYRVRCCAEANREASNALFARLCQELHRRGMRIILDGVFNHAGMLVRWLDRGGIFGGRDGDGAWWSDESPYRDYFRLSGRGRQRTYESWYGYETLPKLNYEGSERLEREILDVVRHWTSPPYSVDGWRLDAAYELGHSEAFNHGFWRRFREAVREANPECLIVSEHYGYPAAWLDGTQWDTCTNFDAFMDPLTYFLTGMDKYSYSRRPHLYQDGNAFFDAALSRSLDYPWPSLLSAMMQLSTHDHSRFITRTNRRIGRMSTCGQASASEGIDLAVMREAVCVQMSWPGAPTIYYGDEAGLVGWCDPDNRRTYPWGHEDLELIALHRELARLRRIHPCLVEGALVVLGAGHGWIAFGRLLANDWVVTLVNNDDVARSIPVRLREVGADDAERVVTLLSCSREGHDASASAPQRVESGFCRVTLAPRSAVLIGRAEP